MPRTRRNKTSRMSLTTKHDKMIVDLFNGPLFNYNGFDHGVKPTTLLFGIQDITVFICCSLVWPPSSKMISTFLYFSKKFSQNIFEL